MLILSRPCLPWTGASSANTNELHGNHPELSERPASSQTEWATPSDLQGWTGGQLERQQQSVIAEYFVITSSVVEEVLYCPSSFSFAALLSLHPSCTACFGP
jgi:hypothetical protein